MDAGWGCQICARKRPQARTHTHTHALAYAAALPKTPKQVAEDDLNSVTLKCSECEQTVRSTWFWRHPKLETLHILVPNHGHRACGQKMGRKCPWFPVGDQPSKLDSFDKLDFCDHKIRRTKCFACGGSDICEHEKQYSKCKLCKGRRQAARVNTADRKRACHQAWKAGCVPEWKGWLGSGLFLSNKGADWGESGGR